MRLLTLKQAKVILEILWTCGQWLAVVVEIRLLLFVALAIQRLLYEPTRRQIHHFERQAKKLR
ncbi:hypothetical protein A7321_16470 [Klebsiella pneumoniae]|nr:hypothetical protein A7321_16470 [Klebsiella pneumoniae]ANN51835.1 hypothetical protein BAU11_09380 [Klebsiella pneumoniae]